MELKYNAELHSKLLEIGRELEKGVTHKLKPEDVETIIATFDYFNASEQQLAMINFDLRTCKYKVFDWLGMCYSGRLDVQEGRVFDCIEMMVKLYIFQKHIGGFVQWLRGHDSDIEQPSRCEDCIKTYEYYASKTPEDIQKELKEKYGDDTIIIS